MQLRIRNRAGRLLEKPHYHCSRVGGWSACEFSEQGRPLYVNEMNSDKYLRDTGRKKYGKKHGDAITASDMETAL